MNILVNRRVIDGPWGGGNLFVRAICARAPERGHVIQHDMLVLPDVVLMVDPRYDSLGISINEIASLKLSYPNIKVVHRVNECDARKGTSGMDQLLRASSQFTDVSVFVSEWIRDYHLQRNWNAPMHTVIYNGVERQHFRPMPDSEKPKDVVRIVTHHWSNNEMKGFDFYETIDNFVSQHSEYEFTYVGRHRGTFSKVTRVVDPLFGQELGDELRRHHVYISGSWFDPGPNHVIESLASGLITWVREDGGGAVEFAGSDHTIKNTSALVDLLRNRELLLAPNNKAKKFGSWIECADRYIDLMESL